MAEPKVAGEIGVGIVGDDEFFATNIFKFLAILVFQTGHLIDKLDLIAAVGAFEIWIAAHEFVMDRIGILLRIDDREPGVGIIGDLIEGGRIALEDELEIFKNFVFIVDEVVCEDGFGDTVGIKDPLTILREFEFDIARLMAHFNRIDLVRLNIDRCVLEDEGGLFLHRLFTTGDQLIFR